ncbi:hypothetical protein TRFO_15136 [Tritrichomonas foetus]|uniref:Protein kinase domain-containing protein n=1 Tax=Tritrichomonas foetus TaxID=1144522 RepID=A0A1J4KTM9_9EUKA|nr:hypothetical protein TRFO_15136 [Tritrichomonas foetus]|eukprot:OHT14482.1 hypothetical protein TRFO_15136 [Tritrichomonas foetus]
MRPSITRPSKKPFHSTDPTRQSTLAGYITTAEQHYEVVIDESTLYTTYRVSTFQSEMYYVLKQYNHGFSDDYHAVHSLEFEIKALQNLKHPAIIRLMDHSLTQGSLRLEFLPRGTLREAIQSESNFTPTNKLKAIYGIASALEYMHKLGFVHPDLVPERLRFDILMEIRLCSFDHCYRFDNAPYKAPEVESFATSPASNIFSLGAIMFEVFAPNEEEADKIDPSIMAIMRQCLDENPMKRPHATEILTALRQPIEIIPGVDFITYSLYIEKFDILFPSQKKYISGRPKLLSDFLIHSSDIIYTNDDLIGKGSYASVFHASLKNAPGINIALKKYDNHIQSDGNMQIYLLREVEVLISLNHPAIIKMIGHNLLNFEGRAPLPLLALDFMPNKTLKDMLHDSSFGPTDKMKTIYGIASALEYMHTRKNRIIHRDLKLDNIMFNNNKEPVICDFNQAKRTEKYMMDASTKFGSPLYCAPEIRDNEDEYTPSVDIFSFGMIMYRIVSGHKPFKEIPDIEKVRRIQNEERPQIDDPPVLADLIKKCWAHNPESRPIATEVVRILRNLSDQELIEGTDYKKYMKYVQKLDFETKRIRQEENPDLLISNRIKRRNKFAPLSPITDTDFNTISLMYKRSKKSVHVVSKQIKVVNTDCNNYTVQQSLIREIETYSRINHPAIIPLIGFDLFAVDPIKKPVIFLQAMEKGNLYDLIQNQKITQLLKMKIIYSMIAVLNHLHQLKIVHCDLTPNDVLFDDNFRPYIGDFNCSVQSGEKGIVRLHDPDYKAPELLTETEIVITDKIDMFAFAAVAYFTITGKSPSNGIIKFDNSECPENLASIIEKCASRNPEDRPQAAQVLSSIAEPDNWLSGIDSEQFFLFQDEMKPVPRLPILREPNQPRSIMHHSPRANTTRVESQIQCDAPHQPKPPCSVRPPRTPSKRKVFPPLPTGQSSAPHRRINLVLPDLPPVT